MKALWEKKERMTKGWLCYEDAVGVVEVLLILVVLIALVLIFKDNITDLVESIFDTINESAGRV